MRISNRYLLDVRKVMAILCLAAQFASAQQPDLTAGPGDIPEHFHPTTSNFDFSRLEVMIPMRDGVRLFTEILIPKDTGEPMPIVLTRTPYNARRRTTPVDGASPILGGSFWNPLDVDPLVRSGYIIAYQDIRGKYASEGIFVLNRPLRGPLNSSSVDEGTDAWDTIDWLVKNVPGNNGRVGITGVSYDGFLTWMALIEAHPALKAAIPINAMVDTWRDDWFHNGAFRQAEVDWIYSFTSSKGERPQLPYGYYDVFSAFLDAGTAGEFGRRQGIDELPAWKRMIDNPAYTALWQDQALQKLLAGVDLKVPTLTVHSLFDQDDMWAIAAYNALAKKGVSKQMNSLVMGPWYHGQSLRDGSSIGKIRWKSDTAYYFREKVRQAFWDLHLKGREPLHPLPGVLAFETGTNEWREYDSWPPSHGTQSTKIYLHSGARLGFAAPTKGDGSCTAYVADPGKPIPYRVRPIRPDYSADSTFSEWLVDDQRAAADRPDVVSFVSEPLSESLIVSGQALVNLIASTTGTDADWVVKLIDQYPNEYPVQPELGGYQLMIAADIFRGRYREGFEVAKPIAAGKRLVYRLALPDANHAFLRGHRIIVQIQNSWFPLYDRNPQTFVENIAWARPEAYRAATYCIFHAADAASFVELPINTLHPVARRQPPSTDSTSPRLAGQQRLPSSYASGVR
jgi:putative CocE/NonD family hydrolase